MSRLAWRAASLAQREYRRTLAEARAWSALAPAAAEARSRERLHRYLEYCRTHSPYWRERWPAEAARFTPHEAREVLRLLPPLGKRELREQLDALRIAPSARARGDGYPAVGRQHPLVSGGSTGAPVRIWGDTAYMARWRATADYLYELCGLPPGEPFFYLWGSNNELAEVRTSWRKRVSTRLRGVILFSIYGLTPEKARRIAEEMAARPRVRSAVLFASAAETLVSLAEAGEVTFPRVARAFTGGGMLTPRLRTLMERHLADEVFDTYASRDLGMMAHETPAHDGLSVAGWMNEVEVLGDGGAPAAPGEAGEVHVTAVSNFSCALIRVATGDRARLDPSPGRNPLPGGRITALEGRTMEHLRAPNGVVVDPVFVVHTVGVVISPPWLHRFQLVQRGDAFRLRAEPFAGATDDQVRELDGAFRAHLQKLVGAPLDFAVEVAERIEPLPSGKHAYCVREAPPPG